MLLEDQYGVGDHVDLGDAIGTIERVGLRTTTVRDVTGMVWYVRNGTIERVGNGSQDHAVAVVDVPLALDTDITRAAATAEEAAAAGIDEHGHGPDVLEKPQVLGVESLSSSGHDAAADRDDQARTPVGGPAVHDRARRRRPARRRRRPGGVTGSCDVGGSRPCVDARISLDRAQDRSCARRPSPPRTSPRRVRARRRGARGRLLVAGRGPRRPRRRRPRPVVDAAARRRPPPTPTAARTDAVAGPGRRRTPPPPPGRNATTSPSASPCSTAPRVRRPRTTRATPSCARRRWPSCSRSPTSCRGGRRAR